ncbi:MAG: hypothetical protein ABIH48_02560, partial [Candidatus Falkowbacteria bacterium]
MKKIYQISAYFMLILLSLAIFAMPAYADVDQWEINTPAGFGGTINTVEVFGDYIFLGTDEGLYKSSNSGEDWTNYLNTENITSIVIGWETDNTFGSPTFGQKITSANSPIFIGTSVNGVYEGTRNSASWTETNTGLGDLSINDLSIGRYYETVLFPMPSTTFKYDIFAGTDSGTYKLTYSSFPMPASWSLIDNTGSTKLDSNVIAMPSPGYNIFATRTDNSFYQYQYIQAQAGNPMFGIPATPAVENEYTNSGLGTLINVNTDQASNAKYLYITTDSDVLRQSCPAGGCNASNWDSYNTGLEGETVNSTASDYTSQVTEILYAATENGVYKNYDTTPTPVSTEWTQINKNLTDTVITEVKTDPLSSTNIYAISNDNLFKLELSNENIFPIIEADTTAPATTTTLHCYNST